MSDSKAGTDKHHPAAQGDVIYVLRTSQQHHVMLGMMADRKANIMLGAFLIFITVTQKMAQDDLEVNLPIWVLTVFFTLSAVFALLVIAPRFRSHKGTSEQQNLLFFGSFTPMSQDDYIKTLSGQLQNNEQARELLMKDIYQIGQVLYKKYQNLRYCYACLGIGIVLSVLVFAWLQLMQTV